MDIDLPDFVPAAPSHVDSSSHARTDQVDVWRHYDLERAERHEPPAEAVTKDTAVL